MAGWRQWLPRWRRSEGGFSEAATAIFVLPLLALLIFMLIETGWNLRYRLLIDNVVAGATRGVALEGGNCNPDTSTCNRSGVPLADRQKPWNTLANQRIAELCDSSGPTPRCSIATPPGVVCTPTVAAKAGDRVSCTVTVTYRPLTGMAKNPITSLGFSLLLTSDITTTSISSAGVGQS